MGGNREVDVRLEGVVNYTHALDLMKQLQKQRIDDEIPDTLLIMEHPEIVTVGPRARNDGILPPEDYATHPVDRGGGLTWHGPGQLVAYPIFKWDLEGEVSVAAIIQLLEEWIIKALAACNINGYRDERMQGVWVDNKKISSIGLSFLRWTSRHGFTINYSTPKGRVEMLAGCGLENDTTTSLAQLGYTMEREQLLVALLQTMNETIHRSQKKE
ncbi:MAG: lipoyl(octanoyl) transferase LipB [Candidatus Poseidoniaceae archaeon]|nr:lipoyl(octanoyl) transferase LipB [Candidatus Poseidoniaceae archaeon]|tara:strand:- start:73 stop:714 length:642 start_codon:yes stop_codon:yes gene_type:complete